MKKKEKNPKKKKKKKKEVRRMGYCQKKYKTERATRLGRTPRSGDRKWNQMSSLGFQAGVGGGGGGERH